MVQRLAREGVNAVRTGRIVSGYLQQSSTGSLSDKWATGISRPPLPEHQSTIYRLHARVHALHAFRVSHFGLIHQAEGGVDKRGVQILPPLVA